MQRSLFVGGPDSVTNSLVNNSLSSAVEENIQLAAAKAFALQVGMTHPDVIKIDTEGCELPIISSMIDSFRNAKAIYLEYHSEDDRLAINNMLSQTHILFFAKSPHPHRGEMVYVRNDAFPTIMQRDRWRIGTVLTAENRIEEPKTIGQDGPRFTQDWSRFLESSLTKLSPSTPVSPMKVLEIGSFEGRGTRLLFKKLVEHHEESRLYCVDPWVDGYVPGKSQHFAKWDPFFVGQFQRFLKNTLDLGPQLVRLRGISDDMVPAIKDPLDFAYIDGDHSAEQVYRDAAMILPLMKNGGIVLFDDYPWTHEGNRCGDGVDRWLAENDGKVELLFKEYQLAVRVN